MAMDLCIHRSVIKKLGYYYHAGYFKRQLVVTKKLCQKRFVDILVSKMTNSFEHVRLAPPHTWDSAVPRVADESRRD